MLIYMNKANSHAWGVFWESVGPKRAQNWNHAFEKEPTDIWQKRTDTESTE
jgi:hypothetical protein